MQIKRIPLDVRKTYYQHHRIKQLATNQSMDLLGKMLDIPMTPDDADYSVNFQALLVGADDQDSIVANEFLMVVLGELLKLKRNDRGVLELTTTIQRFVAWVRNEPKPELNSPLTVIGRHIAHILDIKDVFNLQMPLQEAVVDAVSWMARPASDNTQPILSKEEETFRKWFYCVLHSDKAKESDW